MPSPSIVRRSSCLVVQSVLSLALAVAPAEGRGEVDARSGGATAPNIRGVVTDSAGAPIANVTVTIAALSRVTTTSPEGRFVFSGLPPGSHHLDAVRLGYARAEATVVLPSAGEDVRVTIVMRATPLRLSNVVVSAAPLGGDPLGLTQSTADVSGKELARTITASVAQTLEREPGMATRYNGPAATLPVVRGLTGDRIVVLQDGERSGDLSASAPDHGLSIDPLSADRIEVIRGPASLLFGTNALGGVVNVLSNDIPSSVPTHLAGFLAGQTESVSPGAAVSGALTVPLGRLFAASVGGGFRTTQDVTMGGGAKLLNSDAENYHATLGLGVIGARGTFGLAAKRYDFRYGIPAAPDDAKAGIKIDGLRNQLSFKADLTGPGGALSQLAVTGSAQQYEHAEIGPVGEVGTQFTLKTHTFSATAKTQLGRVDGAFGVSGLFKQYDATGEEALTPAANSKSGGLYIFQDIALGANKDASPHIEFGARYDFFDIATRAGDLKFGAPRSREFRSGSGSVGFTIPFTRGASLGVSVARAFRVPTVEELFSNAFHPATGTFDVGDPDLRAETNTGLDGVVRVHRDRVQLQLGAYVNRIDNFITPNIEGDTVIADEGGTERVPLNRFSQRDASLKGFEASIEGTPTRHLVLGAMTDLVRGELAGNRPVPFLPAARVGAHARWDNGRWSIGGEVRRGMAQSRVAGGDVDIATEAYTTVGANVGWTVLRGGVLHVIALRADNVFDERYRDATSWIKRFAFNPGRNAALVYRVVF
jgi:iron complex outermembrane receptor protein